MLFQTLSHSQNFLHNPALVEKLIAQSNISPSDIVIEIGPGKGIITRALAKQCSRLIAVEYDDALYRKLKRDFVDTKNVTIHRGDFLDYRLPEGNYKIFASIPFNITAAILARIMTGEQTPIDAYLIIQSEAAKKYAGQPYYKESLKSLNLKPRFEMKIAHNFQNADFTPRPSANIVFLHIRKRELPMLDKERYRQFSDFLAFVFSKCGRGVGDRLKHVFSKQQLTRLYEELRFSEADSAVDLSFEQWMRLFYIYLEIVSPDRQCFIKGAAKRLNCQQRKMHKLHRNRNGNGKNGKPAISSTRHRKP